MGNLGNFVYLLAVVLGLLHAVYLYRREAGSIQAASSDRAFQLHLRALYFALWTIVLWLILGPYVVIGWLLALVPYLIARAWGKTIVTDRRMAVR